MQLVFIPDRKLFGQIKIQLQAKEIGEFSVTLNRKMSWWSFFCPPSWLLQYKMYGDFLNFELLSHWYINLKLAETFQNWVINIVVNILSKKVFDLNF